MYYYCILMLVSFFLARRSKQRWDWISIPNFESFPPDRRPESKCPELHFSTCCIFSLLPPQQQPTMTDSQPPPSLPPPLKILVRTKTSVKLFTLKNEQGNRSTTTPATTTCTLLKGSSTLQCLSPDGSHAYIHVSGKGIYRCDLTTMNDSNISTISVNNSAPFFSNTQSVQMMHLSPLGKYLLTWERLYADSCPRNLKVWDTRSGNCLASFAQKSLSRASWPYLQFTWDEQFACLLVPHSQVRVYAAEAFLLSSRKEEEETTQEEPRFVAKIQVPNCVTLSVPSCMATPPPDTRVSFVTFSSGTKDKPAVASVYQYNNNNITSVTTKSLFQAEDCNIQWSPTGTACTLTLQTSVDASGESYYGSSQLWLWNQQNSRDIVAVDLPQAGSIQSVQWLPNIHKPPSFVVVAGKMPAMTSQHHGQTGQVLFLFGNNVHRNTVSMAPHGRFVCLAGFGNLAGGMGFWDLNKKQLLPHVAANGAATLRAETTVTMHGWSPDSRVFLVATTAPRQNVDNGVVLYKYTGERLPPQEQPWDNSEFQPNHLLEACFVPSARDVYPDRPQSPPPTPEASGAATTTTAAASAQKPAGRYVPPSARKLGGKNRLAERLRQEKEASVQGATAVKVQPEKTKSQLKREKLKKKKEQEAQEQQRKEQEEKRLAEEKANDPARRAKKIKKLLKQIEELKQKTDLNDDQQAKLATEASLRAELEQLGV